jgi:hypothetical protein
LRNGPVEDGKNFCHAGARGAIARRERVGAALERAQGPVAAFRPVDMRKGCGR